MALISCPECSKRVSEKAPRCPHCGNPIATAKAERKPEPKDRSGSPVASPAGEQKPAEPESWLGKVGKKVGGCLMAVLMIVLVKGCIAGVSKYVEKQQQQRAIDDALKNIRQGK